MYYLLLVCIFIILFFAIIFGTRRLQKDYFEDNGDNNLLNWISKNTIFIQEGNDTKIGEGNIKRIYAIVLPERLDKFRENLSKIGLLDKVWILKAFPKNELNYEELRKMNLFNDNYYKEKNKGRIACHLSHLACLYHMSKSKLNNALILEDDLIQLEPNVIEKLDYVYKKSKEIEPNVNIIYYGYIHEPTNIKRTDPISSHLPGDVWKLKSPKGRHGYLVTRDSANIILNNTVPMYHNGDEMYARLIHKKVLNATGPRDQIFLQNRSVFGSTLGNDMREKIPLQFHYK